jgi:predicted DNA-binding transcriptional regulator AlpA
LKLKSPNLVMRTLSIDPRGLNRDYAASYIGIGTSLFDALVAEGRMPKPKLINNRKVWDRQELDIAFNKLPNGEQPDDEPNPFDGVRA